MRKEYEAERRQSVIDGLHALADFLTEHPDVPVSPEIAQLSYHTDGTDEEKRAEVDRVAAILGVEAGGTDHYQASRQFSGLSYLVVGITEDSMRRYHATMSYTDSVEPEAVRA
jgi:hypothetical protein